MAPIPEKGAILTQIANFWFEKLGHVVPNHLTGIDPDSLVSDPAEKATSDEEDASDGNDVSTEVNDATEKNDATGQFHVAKAEREG